MSLDDYLKAAGPYAQDILAARSEFLRIRLNLQPEIRKIYARVADRLAREIRALPRTGHDLTRGYLRALETALRKEAAQLNADLTASLRSTIEQSVAAGLKPHARITTKLLQQASVGLNLLQAQWAFAAVNTRAVEAIWARARNGLRLSDRIWNITGHNMDAIRDVILDSVTMGRDAVKVARDLEQYLKVKTPVTEFPNMMKRMGKRIPKDITYEALRLARTEMTAAFGEGTIAGGHATASYRGIRWVLSAAHPEPDVCDELAHGGPDHDGVYPRGEEPAYPAHPNELCVLLPQHEDPAAFVKRLREWRDNPSSHPDIDRWYNEVYKVAYAGQVPSGQTPPAGSTPGQPTAADKLTASLVAKEKEIVRRKTEKSYVLDANGEVLLSKTGGKDYVAFTADELNLFKDAVFTHNHPGGRSFSLQDIRLAIKTQLAEIRAATQEYIHTMKPPDLGWPEVDKVEVAYKSAEAEVRREFWDAIHKGLMTVNEAEREHHHRIWLRVAKNVGLKYDRVKR